MVILNAQLILKIKDIGTAIHMQFYLWNLTSVKISGLEINGNVNKMTRDLNVVEGSGQLISIMQCENVVISDAYVHHGQTDGIYIGGKEASINVKVINCISQITQGRGCQYVTYIKARSLAADLLIPV